MDSNQEQISAHKTFIRELPKAELHLHLEGTIGPETLVELSNLVDEEPLSLDEAIEIYKYDDFLGFLRSFEKVTQRMTCPQTYEIATERMIENLAKQGVVHAEVFFAVGELLQSKCTSGKSDEVVFEEYMQALERARIKGQEMFGISILWIIDTSRHVGVELATRVFGLAIKFKPTFPSIIGIGLGGNELAFASRPFQDLYKEAYDSHLRLTNHAGENSPASFIWEALSIGSERIGHALSAIDDETLVSELLQKQVPLEMNPTSNIVLKNFKRDISEHPLRSLFDKGLLVTINSDDPAFFGSNLEQEYWVAKTRMNFSLIELRQLAINSFRASFLSESSKVAWIDKIEAMEIPV